MEKRIVLKHERFKATFLVDGKCCKTAGDTHKITFIFATLFSCGITVEQSEEDYFTV